MHSSAVRSTLSGRLKQAALITAVLIMLTSSFDIFLVIQAGGTYRFCQVISFILILLAAIQVRRTEGVPVLGLAPLCIWLGFQCLFIPTSDLWQKSVAYCLWLLLNIALVFSFVQLFSRDLGILNTLLRWYVYSFGAIAAFGIIQFLLPLVGLPAILVAQWWIKDQLPRVNGFSYEPSYFATYLVIGFVFIGGLRRAKSPLFAPRVLAAIQCLTAAGIIVSSSRMGMVFVCIELLLSSARPWFSFVRQLTHNRVEWRTVKALLPSLLYLGLLIGVALQATWMLESNPAVMLMLLNGTGVSDTAAHSVIQREGALHDTLSVFASNPIVGQSLGGVSSAIANLHGETVSSIEASKQFEGMNVFAEALAASGVIGIIPFIVFLVKSIRRPLVVAALTSTPYSGTLRALVRSLVFGWAVLQFNQNLLRPYLWVHIAILATVYASALPMRRVHRTLGAGSARACRVPPTPA